MLRVPTWAARLLATAPFQRIAGVSLSDVPGDLLFGHPFPSRLDHSLGVLHLARISRPDDRELQVAALAHDLGHGPFSHLTEPLMIETLGLDHEMRSVRLLEDVRAALSPAETRDLGPVDWDAVAGLMLGESGDGRGALLNGRLDFDNLDNIARFLVASGLGAPSYDPETLAGALRLASTGANGEPVAIAASARHDALAWRMDRARLYAFLHEGHHNLAAHAMLRKAVDLAAASGALPATFFDETDTGALIILHHALRREQRGLLLDAASGASAVYRCVWEGVVPDSAYELLRAFPRRDERLALESRLADCAGLPAHAVVVDMLVSAAQRELPPFLSATSETEVEPFGPDMPPPAPRMLHLFASRHAPPVAIQRLRRAAALDFGSLDVSQR